MGRLASVHTPPAQTSSAWRLRKLTTTPRIPSFSFFVTLYLQEILRESQTYLPHGNTEPFPLSRMRTLAACARRASALTAPRAGQRQWRPFSVSPFMGSAQSGSMRPLDGIRVLDMTRVLAGVCLPSSLIPSYEIGGEAVAGD